MTITNGIVILVLLLISIQDFRHRAIWWFLFPALFALLLIQGLKSNSLNHYLISCIINISLFAGQISLLFLYFLIRGKSIKSVINSALGFGDILFLVTVSLAFSPVNFVFFYFTGLVFSLLVWVFLRKRFPGDNRLIPLAGILSVYTSFIFITDMTLDSFNRFNDNFLIMLIYG